MPTLDQITTTTPATWTGDLVRDRLLEAAETERRMPSKGGPRRLGSAWPATPLHDWRDMVHWADARDRVLDGWANSRGSVSAVDVTRMEQAQDWLLWLAGDERRYLEAWALCSARGLSISAMCDHRRIARRSFYNIIKRASLRIAKRLNKQGVQVR